MVLSGSADGSICIWNLEGSAPSKISCLQGPRAENASCKGGISKLVIHPDGKSVLAATSGAPTQLLGLKGGEMRALHLGAVSDAAFSPDGRFLAVAAGTPPTVRFIVGNLEPKLIDPMSKGITSIAFSPDGLYFATASEDGRARIYDVGRDFALASVLDGFGGSLSVVAFSPDGKHFFAGGRSVIRVWASPFRNHPGVALRRAPGSVSDAAFVEADRLITVDADGTVGEWNLSRQALVEEAKRRVGSLNPERIFDPSLCAGTATSETQLARR
jgi:WD40 repeat protein